MAELSGENLDKFQFTTQKQLETLQKIGLKINCFDEPQPGFVHFPSTLIASGDAAKTASNIMANERLYRIGIANNIITFAIDVVLIWAL